MPAKYGPYHLECAEIANRDGRWCQGPEPAPCRVCTAKTLWLFEDENPICPWCHDWLADKRARRVPESFWEPPPPLPAPSMPCPRCASFSEPVLAWRFAGKKAQQLHLAASCEKCGAWIKWLDQLVYARSAPPKPATAVALEDLVLFDAAEDADEEPLEKDKVWIDTSSGRREAKKALPPPPSDSAVPDAVALSRMHGEVLRLGGRLYLDEKGELCSTIPWRALPVDVANGIRTGERALKIRMTEDVEWQLRQLGPHVLTVDPTDRKGTALVAAWNARQQGGLF